MDDIVVQGLILDRVPYQDRDLILTFLTRDFGVVSAIARFARGSLRRFGAGLDLFVIYWSRLRMRAPPRLSNLIGVEPLRQFPGIFEDLSRLEAGQAMLVAARDLLKDAPAPPGVFELVVAQIDRLEKAPAELSHIPLVDLCLGILAELGHIPTRHRCPACGRPMDKRGIVVEGGSIVCATCGRDTGGVPTTLLSQSPPGRAEALAFLAHLMTEALGRPYHIPMRLK